MKTVLITGSHGFIGNKLRREIKQFAKPFCFDTKVSEYFDIFSPELEPILKKSDVVVHLAALVSVVDSFYNPSEVFRVNVLGTARVAELCLKYEKKLIFPSSAAVIHPELSPYAKSKYLAEEIVNGVTGAIPTVILRLFNVYGKGMNKESAFYNFLNSNKIQVNGDGEQTRDFINVTDVVKIMADAVQYDKYNNQMFDVGTGKVSSVNYVAGLFAHYRKKKIEYLPTVKEIKWSAANVSMLKMLYEKSLETDLEKDIKDLCL